MKAIVKMVRGKCALGRGLGKSPLPPRKMLVGLSLSISIYLCVLAGKSFCHAVVLHLGKSFLGEV